jgi:1-acyl-sn-glycerol-3-phosphate acyltransferase
MVKFFARVFLAPLARLIFRPKIIGKRNVPKRGGVLLASNHLSFVDSVVITLVAPRSVAFLAKSDYFTGKGLKGWMSRTFFTGIGAVPVVRGVGQAAQDSLETGRGILDGGDAFAIYPEGTRSLDGRIYRGRTGVAWLALETRVPVIPVALTDTEKLLPLGSKVPRIKRVTVQFGEPMEFTGESKSGRARRSVTDDIMAAIQLMSGQEPAGVYNEPPPATLRERVRRVFRRR